MYIALVIFVMIVYMVFSIKKPGAALLTAPLVCGILINVLMALAGYRDVSDQAALAACLTPLIFVVTLLTVMIAPHEGDYPPWPKRMARTTAVLLIAIPLFLFVVFGLGFFGIYAGLFGVVIIGSLIGFFLTQGRSVALQVISTIGASMRQNLPLPMALESAAAGRADKPGRIMRAISKSLVQGYSLSDAIKEGYRGCPSQALAMIMAAEQIGKLPEVLTEIEADLMEKTFQKKQIKAIQPAYIFFILFAGILFVAGMRTFVVPKFRDIYTDFGVDLSHLPWTTRWLMSGKGSFLGPLAAFLFPGVIIAAGVWLKTKFRPRRVGEPYYLSRIGDALKWYLPVWHWFEVNYSLTQLTGFLRTALQAGFTLDKSIAHAMTLDVNMYFRERMERWLSNIRSGADPAIAARQCGLGPSFSWAFDKANSSSTLDILGVLEGFFRTQYNCKAHVAKYVAGPVAVLGLGCLVGIFVHGGFAPLVALINQMAETVMP